MIRVAVTGAHGFVGSSLVEALRRAGATALPLVRAPRAEDEYLFNLEDRATIAALAPTFSSVDVVVHAAAHVHRPRETKEEVQRFHRLNVDASASLVDTCLKAGVPRFVFVSTIGVYDFSARAIDETSIPRPSSAYAASKLEAEARLRSAYPSSRIARLATVYGRGDRANFARLARAIAARRFVLPGRGRARKSIICIDDAAELLAALALVDEAPSLLNVAAPYAPSLEELCAWFASSLEAPMPPSVPLPLLRLAGRFGDALEKLGLPAPLDSNTLGKLMSDTVVDTSSLESTFPRHRFRSVEEALRGAYRGGS